LGNNEESIKRLSVMVGISMRDSEGNELMFHNDVLADVLYDSENKIITSVVVKGERYRGGFAIVNGRKISVIVSSR